MPAQSQKPPENDSSHRLKPVWRHSSERRKSPQPNYSLSIALQENALRVMRLTRGCLGALLASRSCFAGILRASPASAIRRAMQQVQKAEISGAIIFPATGRAPSAPEGLGVHVIGGRILLAGGICQFRAGNHPKMTRATASSQFEPQQRTQGKPAAELLSEHCFARKCSTSHVLDPWMPRGAPG